jgi:crotonobetainyl-CoA:carnitine CoA-transferase CaiB-like acyl-CoA transferase
VGTSAAAAPKGAKLAKRHAAMASAGVMPAGSVICPKVNCTSLASQPNICKLATTSCDADFKGTSRWPVSGLQGISTVTMPSSKRTSRQFKAGVQPTPVVTNVLNTTIRHSFLMLVIIGLMRMKGMRSAKVSLACRLDRVTYQTMDSMNSLDGIRILDLSRVLAGPWCTQTLADLGADVIKIERPGAGDDTRSWGPPFLKDANGDDTRDAAYYLGANRNKRSVTCDIATPEGQALIRALVKSCHVFIENFKVGDMARYGLDYNSLIALNPSLVYCSVTGFGQTGPYRERAGYDYAVQGMGGLMSITGERDDLGGGPQKVGVAVADLFTGMYATVAILAALRHAEKTGQGQQVDMALLDTQVAMLANLGANYLVSGKKEGKSPGRAGNAHQNIVPYQVFEVAPMPDGTKDHLILAVGNDGQYAKFCTVANRPDLAVDPRFVKNADRVRHRAVLVPILESVMLSRSKSDWLTALEAAKVPCGAINNLAEVFADPHIQARDMVSTWEHPLAGPVELVASPMKLSVTPVRQDITPPTLGQHTDEVLAELLRLDAPAIAALRQQQVI